MCRDESKLGETPFTSGNTNRQTGENPERNPKISAQIHRTNVFEALRNLSRLYPVARPRLKPALDPAERDLYFAIL